LQFITVYKISQGQEEYLTDDNKLRKILQGTEQTSQLFIDWAQSRNISEEKYSFQYDDNVTSELTLLMSVTLMPALTRSFAILTRFRAAAMCSAVSLF